MILAEFPCLYNGNDHKFTLEELDIFKRNVMVDAAGWMGRLWNHPSVVMWVLSNESNTKSDRPWETGIYQDTVLKLDPTRPTMRAGDSGATKFNMDEHDCNNLTEPLELTSLGIYSRWQQRVLTVPNVTCTNTEYMNVFPHSPTMWTGREDKEAEKMVYAQLGMEDTEAMRRLRYDGIWAFMYAGWTKTRTGGGIWKGGFHDPTAAMLHSSLSPVLTSLDLCDPDYLAGQDVITPLCLINDSWHDAKVHVDLMLTEESPEFIPEAACLDKPLAKWSFDFAVKADSLTSTPVRWKVPEKAGSYYLTARTTATTSPPQNPPALWPTRAVLSQRFVRSVPKPEASEAAKKKTVVLLGADEQ